MLFCRYDFQHHGWESTISTIFFRAQAVAKKQGFKLNFKEALIGGAGTFKTLSLFTCPAVLLTHGHYFCVFLDIFLSSFMLVVNTEHDKIIVCARVEHALMVVGR
jgi:hypothetical protein